MNADTMRRQREYFRRQDVLERAVLAAARAGRADAMGEDVRVITSAVLECPAAERGLAVRGVMVDDDAHREQWLVLVELASGASRALVVDKPHTQ
ncbi:hypothetical protein [Paraburkholderia ribeironis]|nr:hypothetical protein [Paraburkholderia ribeironis]